MFEQALGLGAEVVVVVTPPLLLQTVGSSAKSKVFHESIFKLAMALLVMHQLETLL